MKICSNSTDNINLYNYISSYALAGGTWVPALTSGTNIYNPTTDIYTEYQYVESGECAVGSYTIYIIEDTNDCLLYTSDAADD